MSLKNTFPKGAEWRKWDLHIHTPYSLVHHFKGDTIDQQWEQFITDLESLPEEFKVIGVNDYLFIDGYRKVLEYRKNGRLQNLNTILPVVEFRIKKFAGHKDFKRVNFHIIFSDELSPDIIQNQFLSGLFGKYQLSPWLSSNIQWSGIVTPDSLSDLGNAIKSSVSPELLPKYGSDLEEGFNNLNLDERDILTLLNGSSYLKDRFLTAVGKTEWESLSWNDQSIAEKKDIINKVDFVFISSETVDACTNAKNKLKEQLVNYLLLDCSDAHYNTSATEQKDRIGKCFTWIKGDPTFHGLKQIKYEPTTRILIQDEKPEEKTAYNVIDKVKFIGDSNSAYFDGKAIDLNPNLNVIIGGKSSGKSLLLYHIAKAVDPAQVTEKMGVVNEKEYELFGKIPDFDFVVKWKEGTINKLTDSQETKIRQITYVPQMYINHLAEQKGEKKLAELIENVLYQNIEFKRCCEQQYKIIQDLNLNINNDINEVFVIRENVQNASKEYREIGDKKAILENIERVKKEINTLNEKAGFSQKETILFAKLQIQKERALSAKAKLESYNNRIDEYVQGLNNMKGEISVGIKAAPLQWFEITDSIAQQFITENITEDIAVVNAMFDRLTLKYVNLKITFDRAIATRISRVTQIDEALAPFTAKITNQQLLKRLEKELADDEEKIKKLEKKEKHLNQTRESGSRLKKEILENVDKLFENYRLILEQVQKPEMSQIGKGLSLVASLDIDHITFQNSFCGLLDGRSNFNTLFGDCFDATNNYIYAPETHLRNLKSIFDKVWAPGQNNIKFRSGYGPHEAITQLFKDNYRFKYNIKYNGDDILQMSPGKRGLVLLQIILHLSNAKHPILTIWITERFSMI